MSCEERSQGNSVLRKKWADVWTDYGKWRHNFSDFSDRKDMCLDLELWFCIHQMFLPFCFLAVSCCKKSKGRRGFSALILPSHSLCTSFCVSSSPPLRLFTVRVSSGATHVSLSFRSFYGYLIEGEWNMRQRQEMETACKKEDILLSPCCPLRVLLLLSLFGSQRNGHHIYNSIFSFDDFNLLRFFSLLSSFPVSWARE